MQEMSAPQRRADRFGLIALEAGERRHGTKQLAIVRGNDALGEGIDLAEQAAGPVAGEVDTGEASFGSTAARPRDTEREELRFDRRRVGGNPRCAIPLAVALHHSLVELAG
jgi:hypothetical protein